MIAKESIFVNTKFLVTPPHMSGLGVWFLMTREQRLLHEGPRQQKTYPKTLAEDKHVTCSNTNSTIL